MVNACVTVERFCQPSAVKVIPVQTKFQVGTSSTKVRTCNNSAAPASKGDVRAAKKLNKVKVSSHILQPHYRHIALATDSERASGDVRVVDDLVWSFPFTGIPAK